MMSHAIGATIGFVSGALSKQWFRIRCGYHAETLKTLNERNQVPGEMTLDSRSEQGARLVQ
jgi:hypothetical protein